MMISESENPLLNVSCYTSLFSRAARVLSTEDKINIVTGVARGMLYLHLHRPHPIVHRGTGEVPLFGSARFGVSSCDQELHSQSFHRLGPPTPPTPLMQRATSDLKSPNVLMGNDLTPKVADFGTSKIRERLETAR